jgi:hypothetical protein
VDHLGHGWLRQTHVIGGAHHRARLQHALEDHQLVQLHLRISEISLSGLTDI